MNASSKAVTIVICLWIVLVQVACTRAADISTDLGAELRRFAPDESEIFIVVRPQRMRRCAHADWLFGIDESLTRLVPADPKLIELVAVVAPKTSIENFFVPLPPTGTFRLDWDEEKDAPIVKDVSEEEQLKFELAKRTGSRFVGIIRFVEPTKSESLVEWFSTKDDQKKFQLADWDGREVWKSANPKAGVILRLDERTFVVGDPKSVKSGLGRKKPNVAAIDRWLMAFQNGELENSDLVIAADLTKWQSDIAMISGLGSPMAILQKAESMAVAADLTGETLFSCRLVFSDAKSAKLFNDGIELYRGMRSAMMDQALNELNEMDGDQNWFARRAMEIFDSVKSNVSGNDATIELPRPDDFDELIEEFIDFQREAELEAQRQFEELRQELER